MKTDPEKNTEQYIYQISYSYRERVVGFFVLSAFILFSALIITSGKSQHLFEKRVTFYIDVDSSEGISRGSVVKSQGIEVGKVSDLNLSEAGKIRITIDVYEGRRTLIRSSAKAVVNRLANISHALIDIESDRTDKDELSEGAIIPVEETPSLNELLLGIANIIQSADNNKLLTKLETMLPKLEMSVENIHKIITQIATGSGTLGAAVFDQEVEKDLKTVVKSGADILQEAEGIISVAKQRLVQLEPVLTDAKHVVKDIRGVSKGLPDAVLELNEIVAQVKTALNLINSELANLPGTVFETRRTLKKAERVIDSVQNTWPLSNDAENNIPGPLIPVHPGYD